MLISSLPADILLEIASHVALQSGLDLLALSRVSSAFREAARRAGRAGLAKYALELAPGRGIPPPGAAHAISPLLQSCIQELHDVVLYDVSWPFAEVSRYGDERVVDSLLLPFLDPMDKDPRPEFSHEIRSSLFLRNIHKQSIELWDLHDYPPKVAELHCAKRITRSNDGVESIPCSDGPSGGIFRRLELQSITLGEVRIVLAHSFTERTFHLIDAYGQPYLAYNLDLMQTPRPRFGTSKPRSNEDAERYAEAREAIDPDILESDSEFSVCGSECEGYCNYPDRTDFHPQRWSALRLPRRRAEDVEPGILFFHRPTASRFIWVLLMARPDHDSSETMSSGEIDLAWLSSTHSSLASSRPKARHFGMEAVWSLHEEPELMVQMQWLEEPGMRIMEVPLTTLADLSTSADDARAQAARLLVWSQSHLLPELRTPYHLSTDRRLLIGLDHSDIRLTSILSIYKRNSRNAPWSMDPTRTVKCVADLRIVGQFDDWLVLCDADYSVRVLDMRSAFNALQTFHLQDNDFDDLHEPDPEDRQTPQRVLSLSGGWVVLKSEKHLVSGILDLNAVGGPSLVDLPWLVRECLTKHGSETTAAGSTPLGTTSESSALLEHDEAVAQHRIFFYGEARSPNPEGFRLCLDYSDRPSVPPEGQTARPLVLFICHDLDTQQQQQLGETGRPQHVARLHPTSHQLETIFFEATFAASNRLCFSDEPIFKIALERYMIFDSVTGYPVQVLLDFHAGLASPMQLRDAAVVLGRWTNDYAPLLFFHCAEPIDRKQPQRHWFAIRVEETLRGADVTSNLPDEIDTAVYAAVPQDDERDYRVYLKPRLLPNWIVGDDRAIFIGGLHRLLAFLTQPEVNPHFPALS